jgi:hypothetical protein
MEAICSFKISVNFYRLTRRYVTEVTVLRTSNPVFDVGFKEIRNFVLPDGRKADRQLSSLLPGLPVDLSLNCILIFRQYCIKNNIKMDLKIVGCMGTG